MLGIGVPGPTELVIISGVLVLLFGASRLPKLARGMGSSISQFRIGLKESQKALEELQDESEAQP